MSAWKEHVTAALLGTGKAPAPPAPAVLAPALDGISALGDEARFLTQAGAYALWRRAGWKPAQDFSTAAVAEPEATQPIGQASAGHLRTMLSGRYATLLPEWLGVVAGRGRYVLPEFLPALLERARQDRAWQPLALAAGGRRGVWLAAQNPAWAFGNADAPELWETGNREQRLAILRRLRAQSPAEARARIEAVWPAEPAEVRSAFLGELLQGLSNEDTPFLERALEDRSKEVRRIAVDALARLPGSAFVTRMTARAAPLLRLGHRALRNVLVMDVTLPPDPDAAAARDGLDPKIFGPQKALGEKAVLLLLMLSAVPLRHWTDTFQRAPGELLKAAAKNEFALTVTTGWAWAAIRQRDAAWAAALLDNAVKPFPEFLPAQPLLTILPEPARARRVGTLLRAGEMKKSDPGSWSYVATLLASFKDELPEIVCRELLHAIGREAADGLPAYFRSQAEILLLHLPPALLPGATAGWPLDQDGVFALVEFLNFRHEALSALQPP